MTIDDLIRDFLKKQDDARPTLVWVAFKNHRLVAFAVTWVVVVTGGQVAWEPVKPLLSDFAALVLALPVGFANGALGIVATIAVFAAFRALRRGAR